jgi:hypothetical protein
MMGVQCAGLTAKTKINRKDFDLGWGSVVEAGQVAVSEIVTIEIDLETVQQPAAVQESAAQSSGESLDTSSAHCSYPMTHPRPEARRS